MARLYIGGGHKEGRARAGAREVMMIELPTLPLQYNAIVHPPDDADDPAILILVF